MLKVKNDNPEPTSFLSSLIVITILFLGVKAKLVFFTGRPSEVVRRRAGTTILCSLQGRNSPMFTLRAVIFRQEFQRELQ